MRQPSIHINEEDLAKILKRVGIKKPKTTAKEIVYHARNKTLTNRSVTISNEFVKKKANQALQSSKGDVEMLANLILTVRRQMRHRGVKPLSPASRDWGALKELVPLVVEFCNNFNLPKREGFIEYIKTGFERISSFYNYVSKLKEMSESIHNIYESVDIINKDDDKELTQRIYYYYETSISRITGMSIPKYKKPENYVYFIKVKQIVSELGLSHKDYIDAQFSALQWRNGFPEPVQLVSEKAMEYLNKYLYEKNITLPKSKSLRIDRDQLKKFKKYE